jgi:hypothetical protein
MAAPTYPGSSVHYPDNNQLAQPYNRLVSAYDIARKPQSIGEVIKKFGKGLYMMDFLHLADQVKDVTSESLLIIEEGAPERLVTVSIATEAGAGSITVIPDSADNSDQYLREGFDIIIPATYTNASVPTPWRLYLDTGTWKAQQSSPSLRVTSAVTTKEFAIGASSLGYGTGPVTPMSSGFYNRYTKARIMKEEGGVEGGMIFQEDWKEVELSNGKKGILSKLMTEMDFRLNSQIDKALFLGEENTNTLMTATSSFGGGTSMIPSAPGLIPTMMAYSQDCPYTTTFDMTDFEIIKSLFEAVGVTNQEADFLVGSGLNTIIENALLTWIQTVGASNELYDRIEKYTGFNTRTIMKNSIKFRITQLSSLSNPSSLGGSEYPYTNWGFIFPKGEHSVRVNDGGVETKLKLPHLTLGYAVGKNENRRRTFKIEQGVSGLNLGSDFVANGYDGTKFHSLTHIVPIWTFMNQTVLVQPS